MAFRPSPVRSMGEGARRADEGSCDHPSRAVRSGGGGKRAEGNVPAWLRPEYKLVERKIGLKPGCGGWFPLCFDTRKIPRGMMRRCEVSPLKHQPEGGRKAPGTQRFLPELGMACLSPCFSHGQPSGVRTRRGARRTSGACCYSTKAAGVVVHLGLAPGPRGRRSLTSPSASAARNSGNEV